MDILSDILDTLRLSGSLFFRSELEPPWGIDVPVEGKKAILHIIADGHCCLKLDQDAEPIPLSRGDLVLVTQAQSHQHKLFDAVDSPYHKDRQGIVCGTDQCEIVEGPADLLSESAATTRLQPALTDKTVLICGYFDFDEEILHPLFHSLPPKMNVKTTQEVNLRWLDNTIHLIRDEAFSERPGADAIANRMSEILFIKALRIYVEENLESLRGISALHDRYLSRALNIIHSRFHEVLNVQELASEAGLSRTAFSQRFTKLMGMSTSQYITHWRLQKAKQMLLQEQHNILDIAVQIGYQTEAAFNKVFKRHFGITPGAYRRKHYLLHAL